MGDSVSSGEARAVWFEAPGRAVLRHERLAALGADEILVEATVSLISAGTELLAYKGLIPSSTALGAETYRGSFGFPLKYAYQVVGRVVEAGDRAPYEPGDLVFCKHPHQDFFTIRCDPRLVFGLPAGFDPVVASFTQLGNVAVQTMLDMPVRIGDRVVVFGMGIVGQLCALLAQRTASSVVVVDPSQSRRERARAIGLEAVLDPTEAVTSIWELTQGIGTDIAIEASGATQALQQAISVVGQEGTVVVVSYYGTQPAVLTLAPEFHFRRQRLVSSQAAQIGSGLQPRWSLERRTQTTLDLLSDLPIREMVSHEIEFSDAASAYEMLDHGEEDALGVLLTY